MMAELLKLDTVGVQCKKDSVCNHQNHQTFLQHKHDESVGASEWTNTKKGERTPPQTVIMLCIQHFYKRRKKKTQWKCPSHIKKVTVDQ